MKSITFFLRLGRRTHYVDDLVKMKLKRHSWLWLITPVIVFFLTVILWGLVLILTNQVSPTP